SRCRAAARDATFRKPQAPCCPVSWDSITLVPRFASSYSYPVMCPNSRHRDPSAQSQVLAATRSGARARSARSRVARHRDERSSNSAVVRVFPRDVAESRRRWRAIDTEQRQGSGHKDRVDGAPCAPPGGVTREHATNLREEVLAS